MTTFYVYNSNVYKCNYLAECDLLWDQSVAFYKCKCKFKLNLKNAKHNMKLKGS